MKYYFLIVFLFLISCQEKVYDSTKQFDQKYVDSTLKSIKDSLDKNFQKKYDSLLNNEAELQADSILNSRPNKSSESDDYNLKTPIPKTKDLPEPTGPEYRFPDEE